jgi:hypothetical protein
MGVRLLLVVVMVVVMVMILRQNRHTAYQEASHEGKENECFFVHIVGLFYNNVSEL